VCQVLSEGEKLDEWDQLLTLSQYHTQSNESDNRDTTLTLLFNDGKKPTSDALLKTVAMKLNLPSDRLTLAKRVSHEMGCRWVLFPRQGEKDPATGMKQGLRGGKFSLKDGDHLVWKDSALLPEGEDILDFSTPFDGAPHTGQRKKKGSSAPEKAISIKRRGDAAAEKREKA